MFRKNFFIFFFILCFVVFAVSFIEAKTTFERMSDILLNISIQPFFLDIVSIDNIIPYAV